jgi:hypothetical protein
VVSWGTERQEFLKQQQGAIDNANKARELQMAAARDADTHAANVRGAREYWNKALSASLATAGSQEQWDGFMGALHQQGAPQDLLAQYGHEYSPDAVKRARALGLTPKEQADVAGAAEGRGEVRRHNREMEGRRSDPNADDPALPRGVQDYLVDLVGKHSSYKAATAELSREMNGLRRAHPRLSSGKAAAFLHRQFTGAGAGDGLSGLIAEAMAEPTAPAGQPQTPGRTVTGSTAAAALPNAASVEDQAQQILEAAGYDSSPESVSRFLSNPANRQRVEGTGAAR